MMVDNIVKTGDQFYNLEWKILWTIVGIRVKRTPDLEWEPILEISHEDAVTPSDLPMAQLEHLVRTQECAWLGTPKEKV